MKFSQAMMSQPAAAPVPMIAAAPAAAQGPAWMKPGYVDYVDAPALSSFFIQNADTGAFWSIGADGSVREDGTGTMIPFTLVQQPDIYPVKGAYMFSLKTDKGFVRHSNYTMQVNDYAPNNYDFAWHFYRANTRSAPPDSFIIWNAYPADGMGMYVNSNVDKPPRPRIDPGTPSNYRIVGVNTPTAIAVAAKMNGGASAASLPAYTMKPDVAAYGGDQNLASKTLATVTGDANSCMTQCDANPACTHFAQTGNSCTLYSGAEWVGGQPGANSYCKAQCQGDGKPVVRTPPAGTSGYASEGSPFSQFRRDWTFPLILILFVFVILLWIMSKKI